VIGENDFDLTVSVSLKYRLCLISLSLKRREGVAAGHRLAVSLKRRVGDLTSMLTSGRIGENTAATSAHWPDLFPSIADLKADGTASRHASEDY
jgi:hypothetical protein